MGQALHGSATMTEAVCRVKYTREIQGSQASLGALARRPEVNKKWLTSGNSASM